MTEEVGYKRRDYRGTEGAIDDAVNGAPDENRRLPRGRIGAGRPKSPRPGVRDPGKPTEGPEGEKAYGPPIDDSPENRGKKK
jgi:hypothetical protein